MCPVRSVTHVTERTDGLAPPGCARPRRQPLVRAAPGSIRDRSCRTSRLSTPRARGPVLAAGARTRDIRFMRLPPTRGGEATAEPTPLAHRVPGPLAGGAVAAPCRPPRKATGASMRAGQVEVPPHPSLRAGPRSRGRPRSTRLHSASTTTARPVGTRDYSDPQLPDFALVDASGQGSRARCGCSQA